MILVTELRRTKGIQPSGLWGVPWVDLQGSASVFKNTSASQHPSSAEPTHLLTPRLQAEVSGLRVESEAVPVPSCVIWDHWSKLL